jgi:hypothetical protein
MLVCSKLCPALLYVAQQGNIPRGIKLLHL